jgi:hypothetical protein
VKVLFVVTNYYIQLEPYAIVAERLSGMGVESVFYNIGVEPVADFESTARQVNLARMFGPVVAAGSLLGKSVEAVRLLSKKRRALRVLHSESPGLLVINSDVSSVDTRLVMDAAISLKIKVLLLPVVIPGPLMAHPDPDKGVPALARLLMRPLGLERTVFWRGWELGSYNTVADIAAPNEAAYDTLARNLDRKRLHLSGDLGFEQTLRVAKMPVSHARELVVDALKITGFGTLLTLCTGIVQEYYGRDFLVKLIDAMRSAFDALPADVAVIIKLHPREDAEAVRMYRDTFKGERYFFADKGSKLVLLRASSAVIGQIHTSILQDSALLGTPTMSMRPFEDHTPVLFGAVADMTHILGLEEVADKTRKILYDEDFKHGNLEQLRIWAGNHNHPEHEKASLIAAGIICDILSDSNK